MIEYIVMIYALSYVLMELLWLHKEKNSFMEELIHPVNWYSLKVSFGTTILLLFLPITTLWFFVMISKEEE